METRPAGPVKSPKKITYVDVVKGVWKSKVISPDFHVPESLAIGEVKVPMNSNDSCCSQSFNHVQVSLENGILVIKINLGELLSSSDSDSSKDTTFSSGKESSRESLKIELSIVNQSKDVCEGPNNSQNKPILSLGRWETDIQ